MCFRSVLPSVEAHWISTIDFMFEGFFKTNYKKIKTLYRFEGSKLVFSCYRTKCYFAQCLPLNRPGFNSIFFIPIPDPIPFFKFRD